MPPTFITNLVRSLATPLIACYILAKTPEKICTFLACTYLSSPPPIKNGALFGELHALVKTFHLPNNAVSHEQNDIVLGGEGVRVRCEGEHAKRIKFSITFRKCPKDSWQLL